MKIPPFTLRLKATGEQIGVAAFAALKCSAWATYHAMFLFSIAEANGQLPSRQKRQEMVREAFAQVLDQLPTGGPFGAELLRFQEEVAVHAVGDDEDPIKKWLN